MECRERVSLNPKFLHSNKSNKVVFFTYLNSPDLSPVDYSIWKLIQERVYQAEMRDITDLKQRLVFVWAELKQTVVDRPLISGRQG